MAGAGGKNRLNSEGNQRQVQESGAICRIVLLSDVWMEDVCNMELENGGANMPLTPLDIHNKEFSRSFRGYDEDEVNEFLDQIIKDYEAMIRDIKRLEEENAELKEKLAQYAELEETLHKSIVVAQEAAEALKGNARKESQLIIREAEKNADRIINEALMKSRAIMAEIEELKKRVVVYRTRFRTLLEAQLEMLESDEWDFVDEDEDQLLEMRENA